MADLNLKNEIPMPLSYKIRHDWYQTDTHVVITILAKNVSEENFKSNITEKKFQCTILLEPENYNLEINLSHQINSAQSQIKILPSKIEVKLKKIDGIRWNKLENDNQITSLCASITTDSECITKYPSSSQHTKDWDKLISDIKKEEKEEKPEGDAALNQLFQQIYSDGSDEVRKAMNKSFSESGGTVLSTNWNEIGKEKVDVKPPDGMEFKKWET